MTLGPSDAFDALRGILTIAESIAETSNVELPDRRYVTFAGVVYDCEQIVVSGSSISPGVVGGASPVVGNMSDGSGWTISTTITIVRTACQVPGEYGEPPDEIQIEADAEVFSTDTAFLVAVIDEIAGPHRAGAAVTSLQYGRSGGMISTVISATVNLWAEAFLGTGLDN